MAPTVVEWLNRGYAELAETQDAVAFLRGLETYLQAVDDERPARRVLRDLRAEHGPAGLAEQRLRLVSDALVAAEPRLIEAGEPEPVFLQHARLGGTDRSPSIRLLQRAVGGSISGAGEQRELEAHVSVLRQEAEILHAELVRRVARGDGTRWLRVHRLLHRPAGHDG